MNEMHARMIAILLKTDPQKIGLMVMGMDGRQNSNLHQDIIASNKAMQMMTN